MTDQKPRHFNLTLTQIAASAFAAITAAILGSRLGVAGTVVGAALGSVITNVATAVYQHSLERSRERVLVARRRGLRSPSEPTATEPDAGPDAGPHVERQPADGGGGSRRRGAIAAGALATFVLSLVAVTGIEALRGGPLSGGDGTTIGKVLDGAARQPNSPAPAPVSPSGGATPSSEPSGPTTTPSPTSTSSETITSTSPPTGSTTAPPTTTSDSTPTSARSPEGPRS